MPRRLIQIVVILAALLACASLTGCLVLGYSSSAGWSIWPGSFIVTLLLLALTLYLNRR